MSLSLHHMSIRVLMATAVAAVLLGSPLLGSRGIASLNHEYWYVVLQLSYDPCILLSTAPWQQLVHQCTHAFHHTSYITTSLAHCLTRLVLLLPLPSSLSQAACPHGGLHQPRRGLMVIRPCHHDLPARAQIRYARPQPTSHPSHTMHQRLVRIISASACHLRTCHGTAVDAPLSSTSPRTSLLGDTHS